MADARYRVEPAKTGRSKCKVSKDNIEVGELRFGTMANIAGHDSYSWRKLSLITARIARNVEDKAGGFEKVSGFGELTAAQQAEFLEAMAFAKAGGSKPKRAAVRKWVAVEAPLSPPASSPAADAAAHSVPALWGVAGFEDEEENDVKSLLVRIGIPDRAAAPYARGLAEKGFDCIPAILTLTEADLISYGVLPGHRRLLLGFITQRCAGTAAGACALAPQALARGSVKRTLRECGAAAEPGDEAPPLRRTRSRLWAQEAGLALEEARELLRESDAAEAELG